MEGGTIEARDDLGRRPYMVFAITSMVRHLNTGNLLNFHCRC